MGASEKAVAAVMALPWMGCQRLVLEAGDEPDWPDADRIEAHR